jgi:tetratricopeptide (TPR) repeat protein
MEDAAGRALGHYRRARFPTAACAGELAAALYYGPTPVPVARERCDALLADGSLDRMGEANVRVFLAGGEAMTGRFVEARALLAAAHASYSELGQRALAGTYADAVAADVELLAGDLVAAESALTRLCSLHQGMRNWSALSTRAADLAEVLFRLGRTDDAASWAATAERHGQPDDLTVQPLWRGVRAKVLASRGRYDEAERLGREAVALAERTDALNQRAKVRCDLAFVMRATGRGAEADAEIERAIALYDRKGNLAAAADAAGARPSEAAFA